MAILRHIPILLPVLLTGCYEDFTPDVDTDPVLCIMSSISSGEPVKVDVSHSWLYNDKEAARDHSVDDASVTVYVNGSPADDDYIAKDGDEIRIVAESPVYGAAEGSVGVPVAVHVEITDIKTDITNAVRHSESLMYADISFNMRLALKVTDDPAVDNYYGIAIMTECPASSSMDPYAPDISLSSGYTSEIDPIFKEHIGPVETIMGADEVYGLIFTDRQFSGKSYTLGVKYDDFRYHVKQPEYDEDLFDCTVILNFFTISRSLYNYTRYFWRTLAGSTDMADLGFGEPEWAYSNVSTGAGLITAKTASSFKIPVGNLLKEAFEQAPVIPY